MRIFSLPLLGLMLTGLVASGLVSLFSPFLRFCVLFLLYSVLSGELIRSAAWGGHSCPPALRLPLAFLLGAGFYAVVGWICAVSGVGFSVYVVVLQVVAFVLFGAVFVAGSRRSEGRAIRAPGFRDRLAQRLFVAAALGTAVFFFVFPPVLNHVGDAYDHIGYVRAIASENRLFPEGVLAPVAGEAVETPKSDPRKGTFHPLVAAVASLAGLDPAAVWRWMPIFLAPIAVLAFAAFARALLPGPGYALGALVLFFLFQGGRGVEFLSTVSYGQHFALVAYWLLVVVTLEYGRSPSRGKLVALVLLLGGGAFIHFDVLIHFGLFVLSLLLFSRAFSIGLHAAVRIVAASIVCAVVVLVWKLTVSYEPGNELHTHPQGLLYFFDVGDAHFVPSPVELLKKNGLLFLVGMCMVPFLPLLRRHHRCAGMCLALALPPLVIAMNPWAAPAVYERGAYLLHRFLLNVPAHVITVLTLGSLVTWGRGGNLARKALALVVLFAWAKVFLLSAAGWSARAKPLAFGGAGNQPAGEVGELIDFMRRSVPAGAVVVSDPVTSYVLSAYTDTRTVAVLHQHATPNDRHPFERLRTARSVVSPLGSQHEVLRALEEYDVSYVIVNGAYRAPVTEFLAFWDPAHARLTTQKLDGMDGALERVYESERITMYAVTGERMGEYTWFPSLPFLDEPEHAVAACAGTDTSGPIRITGASIHPRQALPGEEVRLTVAYRRRDRPRSPLPLKLHVRLQDRAYFAAARRYPGDKHVRRALERRQGAFRRFRYDHVPFRGELTADMWPIEEEIYETIPLRLPTNLGEGLYDVELRLVHDTLIPNFALRDFVFNDDSYGGEVCAQLDVRRSLSR
ncbi:MAG: DUF6541 family protein [Candidatus Krumholzibacteriia bacterium]